MFVGEVSRVTREAHRERVHRQEGTIGQIDDGIGRLERWSAHIFGSDISSCLLCNLFFPELYNVAMTQLTMKKQDFRISTIVVVFCFRPPH